MIKTYLRETLAVAAYSSWRATNGLLGAAIAGVALVWPGVQQFSSKTDWWVAPANWLCSFVIYAVVAWIILFIFQFTFVAPFQLWQAERDKSEDLNKAHQLIDRSREIIEHDKRLAAHVRQLFPEPQKQKLASDLWNEHAYWDKQGNMLSDVIFYLDSAEAHFVDDTLRIRAKDFVEGSAELLKFMGFKFFVYPSEQRKSPLRFAMQPSLNIDREGDGSLEQTKKYDILASQLDSHVGRMSQTYDELIKAFHTQLLV